MAADDVELIKETLRDVLRAPGASGKALEAKARAAADLARLNGLVKDDSADVEDELAPDPIQDLHSEFARYQARRRRAA